MFIITLWKRFLLRVCRNQSQTFLQAYSRVYVVWKPMLARSLVKLLAVVSTMGGGGGVVILSIVIGTYYVVFKNSCKYSSQCFRKA